MSDRDLSRVGTTFNLLLDGLTADRSRLRRLTEEVIRDNDEQRSAIAWALHESIAQRLAAVVFELSAAARDSTDRGLAERLGGLRDTTGDIMEELRVLSTRVAPREAFTPTEAGFLTLTRLSDAR